MKRTCHLVTLLWITFLVSMAQASDWLELQPIIDDTTTESLSADGFPIRVLSMPSKVEISRSWLQKQCSQTNANCQLLLPSANATQGFLCSGSSPSCYAVTFKALLKQDGSCGKSSECDPWGPLPTVPGGVPDTGGNCSTAGECDPWGSRLRHQLYFPPVKKPVPIYSPTYLPVYAPTYSIEGGPVQSKPMEGKPMQGKPRLNDFINLGEAGEGE